MIGRSAGGTATPSAGEVGGGRGGAGRDRRAGPAADAVERRSRSSSRERRRELGERVADDPGAVAVVGRRWRSRPRAEERRGRGEVDLRELRSAHERAFWTSGSASPMRSAQERRGPCRTISGSRPRASRSTCGQRRDRRADEAALPARRRVDELLELRPAVRLGEDPAAGDVGERGRSSTHSVAPRGLARGRAARCSSGSSAIVALEEVDAEPAQLGELVAEEGGGDVEERGRPVAAECAARSPRPTAASSGWRTPRNGPDAGHDHAARPRGTRGPRGPRGRRARVATSAAGSWTCSPADRPRATAASGALRDEGAGALRSTGLGLGGRRGRGHRRASGERAGVGRAGRPPAGRGGVVVDQPEAVAGLELVLARLGRARRRSRGAGEHGAVGGVEHDALGLDDPRGAPTTTRPSARIGLLDRAPGRLNSTLIRAVTPQRSWSTSAQAMTSSRSVQTIPPWAMPSQPSNRRGR